MSEELRVVGGTVAVMMGMVVVETVADLAVVAGRAEKRVAMHTHTDTVGAAGMAAAISTLEAAWRQALLVCGVNGVGERFVQGGLRLRGTLMCGAKFRTGQ